MGKMIRFVFWIILLFVGCKMLVLGQITNPSTYTLQFANPSVDCSGGTPVLTIDLQIKAEDGAPNFAIGSHTVFMTYNKNAITNATYTFQEFDTNTQCNIGGGNMLQAYQTASFSSSETNPMGEMNLTTLLNVFVAGFECPVITDGTWITMGQLSFDVLDAAQNANLTFDTGLTVLNLSTDDPEHTQGTLSDFSPDLSCSDSPTCSKRCLGVTLIMN